MLRLRLKRSLLSAVVLLATLGLVAGTGSISAAAAPISPSSSTSGPVSVSGFPPGTPLRPNMSLPGGPTATAVAVPAGARPDSSSGCNGNVCIYLTGSGLRVTSWRTTAYNGDYICTFAAYWAPPNTVIATSNEVCGTSFESSLNPPPIFRSRVEVCNTWFSQPGKPCEVVHP